jgi:hypothetical protein
MRNLAQALLGTGLLTLAACVSPSVLDCHPGQSPGHTVELLFGRRTGDRIGVTEEDWGRFVAAEITPRFPDGLTVLDAAGQWRDAARGTVIREPSKVVLIALRDRAADMPRIEQIVDAYKSRFRQQSVGIVVRQACLSF